MQNDAKKKKKTPEGLWKKTGVREHSKLHQQSIKNKK